MEVCGVPSPEAVARGVGDVCSYTAVRGATQPAADAPSLGFCPMADRLNIMAIRPDDEGRIVIGVVVMSYARRPIIFSSRSESGMIERVDLLSILGCKCDVKRHRLIICGAEPKRGLLSAP